MPIRFVWLTFVRCQDGIVLLFCGHRNGIPALRLQPLVKLILIQDPSSAWLGGRDSAILQFHVHRSSGDVHVLDGLIHSHWLVAVLLYGFTTLCLLSGQHGSHAHHLIPKLGDDLREVVECQILVLHNLSLFW